MSQEQPEYSPYLKDTTQMATYKDGPTIPRTIVCAANRWPDGTIVLGVRHWCPLMRKQAKAFNLKGGLEEQGFVDQYGHFLNRVDALHIVKANKQTFNEERNGATDELYSEGLY